MKSAATALRVLVLIQEEELTAHDLPDALLIQAGKPVRVCGVPDNKEVASDAVEFL